jgi:hypothetical protein
VKPLVSSQVPFVARRSMAATARGKNLYFFAGVGANGPSESILDVSDDLWVFDTESMMWRQVAGAEGWPSPRRCVGWTEHAGSLLLWGGSAVARDPELRYTFLNDLWRFDAGAGRWDQLELSDDHREAPVSSDVRPFPRYTPVFQSTKSGVVLYGGYTEDRLGRRKVNDCWLLKDASVWEAVPARGNSGYHEGADWPGLRYGCMSASDGRHVYVCGGFSDDGDHIDVWRFDSRKRTWDILAPDNPGDEFPEARYCAAFCYFDNALFLFGGRSRRNPKLNFNDVWRFDVESCDWSMITPNRSPHRYDGSADFPAYHAKSAVARVHDKLYVWGGEGFHGHVSDFWRLNLESLNWELICAARADDPVFW